MTQANNFKTISEKLEGVTKTLFMEIEKRIEDGFQFNKIDNIESDILGIANSQREFEKKNPVGVQVLHNHIDNSAHTFVLTILGKEMREDMGERVFDMFAELTGFKKDVDLAKHFLYINLVTAVMQKLHGLDIEFNTFLKRADAIEAENNEKEFNFQYTITGVVEVGVRKIAELYHISSMEGKNEEEYIQSLINESLTGEGMVVKDSPLYQIIQSILDAKETEELVPYMVTDMISSGQISIKESMERTDEIFMEVITELAHLAFSTTYEMVNQRGIKSAQEISTNLVKESLDTVFEGKR